MRHPAASGTVWQHALSSKGACRQRTTPLAEGSGMTVRAYRLYWPNGPPFGKIAGDVRRGWIQLIAQPE